MRSSDSGRTTPRLWHQRRDSIERPIESAAKSCTTRSQRAQGRSAVVTEYHLHQEWDLACCQEWDCKLCNVV
jgi:hypothetical protein